MAAPGRRRDAGETLVELVLAISILGIAGVAIMAGVLLTVKGSTIQRNQATGGAYVRSFAEAIQNQVDNAGFASCANAKTTYQGVAVPDLPAGYTKEVVTVQSWTGSNWGACTEDGIQRVNLKMTSTGDSTRNAVETLTVILRKPCNGNATAATSAPCG